MTLRVGYRFAMPKSLWLVPFVVACGLVVAGPPTQLPAPLDAHVRALQAAQSLRATMTVIETSGVTSQWQLSMAKPNKFKLTRDSGAIVLDGKSEYVYTQKDNRYSERPQEAGATAAQMAAEELWVWRAFFDPNAMAKVSAVKKLKNRVIKGVEVVEYQVTFASDPTRAVTVYADPKSSVCRGFSLKSPTRDFIVIVTALELGPPSDPSEFAFTPPAGAVKAEASAAGVGYAQVQAIFDRACMPCHNAQMRSGRLDLTSYQALMSRQDVVVKGDPAASLLVRSLKLNNPSRMPKGRPPLPDAEIALIENWVKAGAPPQ